MTNPIEQDEIKNVTYGTMVASCRQQLIEEELLSFQDGQYFITAKGKKRVEKHLERYTMLPAQLILIEHFMLERHGLSVE
jgi:hypothetical protein